MISKNCHIDECKIMKLFKTKYVQRTDIGSEYFTGNIHTILHDIFMIITQNNSIIEEKIQKLHKCEKCNFSTEHSWVFTEHCNSIRHQNIDEYTLSCVICNKKYKNKKSLGRHKNRCTRECLLESLQLV